MLGSRVLWTPPKSLFWAFGWVYSTLNLDLMFPNTYLLIAVLLSRHVPSRSMNRVLHPCGRGAPTLQWMNRPGAVLPMVQVTCEPGTFEKVWRSQGKIHLSRHWLWCRWKAMSSSSASLVFFVWRKVFDLLPHFSAKYTDHPNVCFSLHKIEVDCVPTLTS